MNSKKYLKIGTTILLMLCIITTTLILSFAFMSLVGEYYNQYQFYFVAITNLIAFGLTIIIAVKIINIPFNIIFPFKLISLDLFISIFITCIGLSIFLSEVDNLFQMLLPMPEYIYKMFMDLLNNDDLLGSIFVLVIVAPLTEELMFRGIIFKSFSKNYKLSTAIILSSLFFGIIHLNPWQFLGASLVGMYLAWLYHGTKNIFCPILAHAIFNGMPLVIIRLFKIEITSYTNKTNEMQPLWFDMIGIILIVIGILLTKKILNKTNNDSQRHEAVYAEDKNSFDVKTDE